MDTKKPQKIQQTAQLTPKNSPKPAITPHNKPIKKQNNDKKIVLTEQKKLSKTKLRMIQETVQTVISNGYNITRASEKLGITTRGIYKRFASYPQIKEQIEDFNQQTIEIARNSIQGSALIASNKLTEIMTDSKNERLQLDSATQILDRSGIVKPVAQPTINILNDLRKDKDTFDL